MHPTPWHQDMGSSKHDLSNSSHHSPRIREHHGPEFTIHLGLCPAVVLCRYDAEKETLIDQAEEFSGCGEQPFFHWFFKVYGGDDSRQEIRPDRHVTTNSIVPLSLTHLPTPSPLSGLWSTSLYSVNLLCGLCWIVLEFLYPILPAFLCFSRCLPGFSCWVSLL